MRSDLHPLNREFIWRRRRPPYRLLTHDQAHQFDDHGYLRLQAAIPLQDLSALIAEIDDQEKHSNAVLREMPPENAFIARADALTFTSHLVKTSPAALRLCRSRFFRDLVADLIGPDVRLYWDHAVYKKPHHASTFGWHQDNGYTFVEPQQYLTCWVALTDANEENGCLWLVPGGHRRGTLRHTYRAGGYYCFDETPAEAMPVPAAAGDIVVFSAVMPHCTGPNRTKEVRKAYVLQFVPDGACTIVADESVGYIRRPAVSPDRQFEVLLHGRAPQQYPT